MANNDDHNIGRACFVYVKEDEREYPGVIESIGGYDGYNVKFTSPNVPSFVTVPPGWNSITIPGVPKSIVRFDTEDAK